MKPVTFGLALALLLPLTALAEEPAKKVETQRITADTSDVVVHRGVQGLPDKVAAMRQKILDAAYSGDLAKLRAVMQSNGQPPDVSVNDVGDPIEFLKGQSGDGEGLEMLAILTDVLETGWTRVDADEASEMYVWPYFAVKPLETLTPSERVELYKVITSGDFDEMKAEGRYKFFTVGIGPDGTWHYFRLAD